MRDKIVVIGSLNYDIIMKLPHFPAPGENVLADSVGFGAGGKGANQAVQSAKLGADTYMIGCVGKDHYGDVLLAKAESFGLNTEYIRRTDAPTGMGLVSAITDGSVFAGILKGANFAVTEKDVDRAADLMKEAYAVILQMEIPQSVNEYAIEKAKECGARVILNAAPAATIDEGALRSVDILAVNEVEAGFYLGEIPADREQGEKAAYELYQRYGCDTIVTLGRLGSVVCEQGQVTFIPPVPVEAVETTGAGDSYIGAVGCALMHGKSLAEAGRYAAFCSALTIQRIGAQDSMGTLEEVGELIEEMSEK